MMALKSPGQARLSQPVRALASQAWLITWVQSLLSIWNDSTNLSSDLHMYPFLPYIMLKTHLLTHIHGHTHIQTHIHNMHIHKTVTYTRSQSCTHWHTHIHICTHMDTHILHTCSHTLHTHSHICTHTKHTLTHIYTCTHTHTDTQHPHIHIHKHMHTHLKFPLMGIYRMLQFLFQLKLVFHKSYQ